MPCVRNSCHNWCQAGLVNEPREGNEKTYLRREARQDDAGAHHECANQGNELDIVVTANQRVDKNTAAPSEAASDGSDERNKGILALCTFDIRLWRCVELLHAERCQLQLGNK